MSLQQSLQEITSSSESQHDKIGRFKDLLGTLSSFDSLNEFATAILNEAGSLGLVVTRPVLSAFIAQVGASIVLAQERRKQLYLNLLERLQPVLASYEEQESQAREQLANVYEKQAEFLQAASTLFGIKLESGQRVISDEFRVRINVRILRNLLEDIEDATGYYDDGAAEAKDREMTTAERMVHADVIINRAAMLVAGPAASNEMKIQFKLSQARVSEVNQKYLDAAVKYFDLARLDHDQIDAESRLMCLSAAVSCTLLAPSGPARARMVASLIKDERVKDADGPMPAEHAMLQMLFYDNLLPSKTVTTYVETARRKIPRLHLRKKIDSGKEWTLDQAVTEHNLVASSKLYENISRHELAAVLNLQSADEAERYAARMIQQRRLRAVIDRVDGIIYFNLGKKDEQLRRWDDVILGVCLQVEDVVGLIQKQHPELIN
ncbi:hypothetical protein V1514DRAFT_352713 [Lipomyces japonicus]|uniref:uncharacterized protein n=1 Tax=Lipomyces japonicus TaxID=56871 RepID=UPI0034CE15A9